eukprot:TRINITY_DN7163_c0_g1_i3.p1 TRINITY_DN7163_c0_g1~~TRINITY_DN7163_c0_g1_i3.p1  ORF type:complete len:558 (+),score=105.34 TRINITY_DN7163_c0_g1_i3:63-1676(+)
MTSWDPSSVTVWLFSLTVKGCDLAARLCVWAIRVLCSVVTIASSSIIAKLTLNISLTIGGIDLRNMSVSNIRVSMRDYMIQIGSLQLVFRAGHPRPLLIDIHELKVTIRRQTDVSTEGTAFSFINRDTLLNWFDSSMYVAVRVCGTTVLTTDGNTTVIVDYAALDSPSLVSTEAGRRDDVVDVAFSDIVVGGVCTISLIHVSISPKKPSIVTFQNRFPIIVQQDCDGLPSCVGLSFDELAVNLDDDTHQYLLHGVGLSVDAVAFDAHHAFQSCKPFLSFGVVPSLAATIETDHQTEGPALLKTSNFSIIFSEGITSASISDVLVRVSVLRMKIELGLITATNTHLNGKCQQKRLHLREAEMEVENLMKLGFYSCELSDSEQVSQLDLLNACITSCTETCRKEIMKDIGLGINLREQRDLDVSLLSECCLCIDWDFATAAAAYVRGVCLPFVSRQGSGVQSSNSGSSLSFQSVTVSIPAIVSISCCDVDINLSLKEDLVIPFDLLLRGEQCSSIFASTVLLHACESLRSYGRVAIQVL